ncbi:MAG TPA: hypothetical protein VET48_04820 [Steroidobacteraceae bacterium]|nr:hypothetical protein [Steroidobacteraceae bacterium]
MSETKDNQGNHAQLSDHIQLRGELSHREHMRARQEQRFYDQTREHFRSHGKTASARTPLTVTAHR